VLECDEILFCKGAILSLSSEETSSSPKDDGLDEVNEAILLDFSDEPFSSERSIRQMADGRWQMADSLQNMCSKKLEKLHIVGLSLLCISEPDI
jgi:hypothetical protein